VIEFISRSRKLWPEGIRYYEDIALNFLYFNEFNVLKTLYNIKELNEDFQSMLRSAGLLCSVIPRKPKPGKARENRRSKAKEITGQRKIDEFFKSKKNVVTDRPPQNI
jgi:hypothetical protein